MDLFIRRSCIHKVYTLLFSLCHSVCLCIILTLQLCCRLLRTESAEDGCECSQRGHQQTQVSDRGVTRGAQERDDEDEGEHQNH